MEILIIISVSVEVGLKLASRVKMRIRWYIYGKIKREMAGGKAGWFFRFKEEDRL